MSSINDLLAEIKNLTSNPKLAVSCPMNPMAIPGVDTAIYAAGDAFGTVFMVEVPKSGIIYSATFWDMDDEGLQTDFEIFRRAITTTANNAAWAPSDADILNLVTELSFVSFDDHGNSRTSELTNIGKAYSAPDRKFWVQAISRSTPTIAASNLPYFQLQILSDEIDYVER